MRDRLSLAPTGRLLVPDPCVGLAGMTTMKFTARTQMRLTCDPDAGGCGWVVVGYAEAGALVPWPQEQEGTRGLI